MQDHDLDNVIALYEFAQSFLMKNVYRIDTVDYIVVYSPSGQSGETAFRFATAPVVTSTPSVTSTYASGTLIINYVLGDPQFISIVSGNNTIVLVVMDKTRANTWHAPVIPGVGTFGQFFSVGTNQT